MSIKKIVISGTGCALADFLYNGVSFRGAAFSRYKSEKSGDGGLSPGKLVFTEELEKYSGQSYAGILKEITGNRPPDAFNVGGPSLVSLIHSSQMLDSHNFKVNFFGMAGKDEIGSRIFGLARRTPLNIENYLSTSLKPTPFTDVFSDSGYAGGHGERTFVNNIGAAWDYSPEHLSSSFFDSDIVCFGGTALVPRIHDNLTELLLKAKNRKCLTIVNTVFDFISEKKNPGSTWPIVNKPDQYGLIDILIMDCEEALKISGQQNIDNAADFFATANVPCFIITDGANDLYGMS
ncbi:MAG: carbohydrate kinase family protein, partial [Bacteroidales bacterium]